MCCLNGVAGTITAKEEQAFKTLLMLGQFRGTDSTGAAAIGRTTSDQPILAKMPGEPWWLMDTTKFKKLMKNTNKVIIGHNRLATKGEKTASNAHPFVFDNIFGAHNGTVYNISNLGNANDFGTDSECLLYNIDRDGIETVIPKLPKHDAWALTWYDQRDNTINMLRNQERPLFWAYNKERTALFWASEVEMIAMALQYAKIDRTDNPRSTFLTENLWHKWEIPIYGQKFSDPITKRVEGFTPTYSNMKEEIDAAFGMGWNYKDCSTDNCSHVRNSNGNVVVVEGSSFRKPYVMGKAPETPAMAVRIQKVRGKNKYPLIYRGEGTKIYYDMDLEQYAIYTWSHSDFAWRSHSTSVKPVELVGLDLDTLLKEGTVFDGTLTANLTKLKPTHRPPEVDDEVTRFRSDSIEIRKSKTNEEKPWITYVWMPIAKDWRVSKDSTPPKELPFDLLDVDANHCFHHRGKKKSQKGKEIFFKGFSGHLLNQADFNDRMENGCLGCGRIPKWIDGKYGGTRVYFVTDDEFLCQYCGEDTKMLKELIEKGKEVDSRKTSLATLISEGPRTPTRPPVPAHVKETVTQFERWRKDKEASKQIEEDAQLIIPNSLMLH